MQPLQSQQNVKLQQSVPSLGMAAQSTLATATQSTLVTVTQTSPKVNRHEKFASIVLGVQTSAKKAEMYAFSEWITANITYLKALPVTNTAGTLVKTDKAGKKLLRSIFITKSWEIFVLFNKVSKLKDQIVGNGTYKKVKLALEYGTEKWWTLASMDEEGLEDERRGQELVVGLPKMITFFCVFSYSSKKEDADGNPVGKKYRMLTQYSGINLQRFLEKKKGNLTLSEKYEIVLQLFEMIITMHQKDIIHADFKSRNIVIDDNLQCSLIDFGSTHKSVTEGLDEDGTSCYVASPEYSEIHLAKANRKKASYSVVNTKASEMWSLGCVAYEVLHEQFVPWYKLCDAKGKQKTQTQIHADTVAKKAEAIAQKAERFNYPITPIECWIDELVRRMFVVDPAKRLTAVELEAAMKKEMLQDQVTAAAAVATAAAQK